MTTEGEKVPISDETRHNLEGIVGDDTSTEDMIRNAYKWVTPGKEFEDVLTTRITLEADMVKNVKLLDEDAIRRKRQMKIAAIALAILVIIITVALILILKP